MNDWHHDLKEFIHEQFEAYKTGEKEQHEAVVEIARMVKLIVGGRGQAWPEKHTSGIGSDYALPPPDPPRLRPAPPWPPQVPIAEDEDLGHSRWSGFS